MYTNKNYGFFLTLRWSIRPLILGGIYASLITFLSLLIKQKYGWSIILPWQPISLIGISVAFYLGFKNNASYERLWEARKIWGAIVNTSRSFGSALASFLGEDTPLKKTLIYRHVAWMTATRYQLRTMRPWEHIEDRINGKTGYPLVDEANFDNLYKELSNYLTPTEFVSIKSKTNKATQIIYLQGRHIELLKNEGKITEFEHIHLQQLLDKLYEAQGKSERIKNFPFPRQYASAALWNTLIFTIFLPFGMLDMFNENTGNAVWLTVPISAIVTWVFFLMEKIGDYSENPFEGGYNDVPITTISRAIEIDLREMIDDIDIPKPIDAANGFQL
jgi:putative membrane protein